MYRAVSVSVILLAGLAVGVAVGVAAPNTDAPGAANDTTPQVEFDDDQIDAADGGTTNLTVSGIAPGTPVEITTGGYYSTAKGYPPSLLALMVDGTPTDDGVRVRVPDDGRIPVDFAPATCETGEFEFTVQRLDTGAASSGHVSVVRYDVAEQSFVQRNYSGRRGSEIPIRTVTNCHGVGLHVWDPDSAFNASALVEDDQRYSTIWLDTTHPDNASRLFGTGLGTNVTKATVTEPPAQLNGSYRMMVTSRLLYHEDDRIAGGDVRNRPQRTWLNVTTAPKGSEEPTNDSDAASLDVSFNDYSVEVGAGDVKETALSVAGAEPGTPLAITADAYPPSLVARLVNGTLAGERVRVTVPENRTIPVDFGPATCRPGGLTFTAKRLDTGTESSATVAAEMPLDWDASLTRDRYDVYPRDTIPITVETDCHGAAVRLWDPDSPLNATAVVDNDDPNVTLWLDTSTPGNASQFWTAQAGDSLTNVTVSRPPAELNGTYRLAVGYWEIRDGEPFVPMSQPATLRVTSSATTDQPTRTTETPADKAETRPSTTAPPTSESVEPITRAETATQTPATTARPASTATRSNTTAGDGAGFGLAIAFTALAGVALLVVRRR
jgi:hypothetical protein